MKIGFFQFSPRWGKIKENLEYVYQRLYEIEAEIIVLPELFNTGYIFLSRDELREYSEEIPQGQTTQHLISICNQKRMYIAGGLAERQGDNLYNSAILVGPSGLIGVYRKLHLFSEEKLIFTPGDTPLLVYSLGSIRVGLMICFDWIFPEVSRSLALKGVDIILHPANLVLPYCPAAMITRCIENKIYALTANRVGIEKRNGKELRFIGQSQIIDPQGYILARASSDGDALTVIDIDPLLARDKNINPHNHLLNDRRTEFYNL